MGRQPQQIRPPPDYAEHLIRLQLNQDTNSQAWTKFFITIQTGLGTAFGILLLYGRFTGFKLVLAFAVAIAGVGTSFVIRKINKSQKSEVSRRYAGDRWDVLRRISIVVFSYARQTRSLERCIDWAGKILRCRSRLPGIAQSWRNRNFRYRHHLNTRRTMLR